MKKKNDKYVFKQCLPACLPKKKRKQKNPQTSNTLTDAILRHFIHTCKALGTSAQNISKLFMQT